MAKGLGKKNAIRRKKDREIQDEVRAQPSKQAMDVFADNELFQIDNDGNANVRKRIEKDLKCFSTLPSVRESKPKTKRQRMNSSEKVLVDRYIKLAQGSNSSTGEPVAGKKRPMQDLWATAQTVNQAAKTKKNKMPAKPEKSIVTACAIPHPGASYRPEETQQQELIKEAVQHEINRLEESQTIRNRLKGGRNLEQEAAQSRSVNPTEAALGLSLRNSNASAPESIIAGDAAESGGEDEIGSDSEINVTAGSFALTKKQRRRMAEQKEKERVRLAQKEAKKQEKQLERAEIIAKTLEKRDAKRAKQRVKEKADREEAFASAPRVLGPKRAKVPRPDVLLSDEVPKNLRTLKSDVNPLKDAFKSFEVRNMIEHRIPKQKKLRYKRKVYTQRNGVLPGEL